MTRRLPSRRTLSVALAALIAISPLGLAAGPAPLPSWDRLTPSQRERLLAPLRERWDSATPEQRERMLVRAERWQQLTPEQRRRAHRGVQHWQQLNPEHREDARALFEHVRTMPEAERRAFMHRWRSMSADERRAWLQSHPVRPAAPRQPQAQPRP